MIGDHNKFLSLKKEKGGSVSFGDNASTKTVGKGSVILGDERTKA